MMNYMKKLIVFSFVMVSCIGLTGASIWEGAAAMAAGGELPETGYYIATNSFPRNTMVDVVNLENGKTLRAIVVGGVDTPGLLGILSKEAASALGLEKGMVGRIRVNMPADPIAFSRYTEELSKGGDPDRDPAAALALTQTESAPATAPTAAPTAVAAAEEKPAEPVNEAVSERMEPNDTNTSPVQTTPFMAENPAIEQTLKESPEEENVTVLEDESIQELPELTQTGPAEPEVQEAPQVEEIPLEAALSEEPTVEEVVSPETAAVVETPEETEAPEMPDPGTVIVSLEPAEERPPVLDSDEVVAPHRSVGGAGRKGCRNTGSD